VDEISSRDLTTYLAPFAKVYKNSSTPESEKNDIRWQVLRFAHEDDNLRVLMPLMDALDSKFKALPTVIETPGDRDIVEGQQSALFSLRMKNSDIEKEYVSETSNSKKQMILSNAVRTLGGEGFRFLEKLEGGGFQEADLKSAMDRVRKKIISRKKVLPVAIDAQKIADAAELLPPLERGPSVEAGDQWDILPGCSKKHPANVAYRRELSEVLLEFIGVCTKEEKKVICARVVDDLECQGFRFVDENSLMEMGKVKAIRKVRKSLMDMVRLKNIKK
jgi:hypothetical protein